MTPERVIYATETGALIVNVYGDLAGQGGQRKLPRPRAIVATLVFYGLLGLIAQLGAGIARVCAAAGSVLLLTMLVGAGVRKVGDKLQPIGGEGGRNLISLLDSATALLTGG